jgi:hypothetical protein
MIYQKMVHKLERENVPAVKNKFGRKIDYTRRHSLPCDAKLVNTSDNKNMTLSRLPLVRRQSQLIPNNLFKHLNTVMQQRV